MNGLPFERNKGLTPISNKTGLQTRNYSDDEPQMKEARHNGASRNNHARMPSLP